MELMGKGKSECFHEVPYIHLHSKDLLLGYEQMVTSRIALEDLVPLGFEELIKNKDDHIKILVSPKLKARHE